MRTLFLEIFLSFWLAMALGGIGLVVVTALTQPETFSDYMTGDRSPIIGKTDVEGLYVNCGWGTGGFKAIPGSGFVFADTIANDRPHPIAEPFGLNRFLEGRLIDESVAAAVAH